MIIFMGCKNKIIIRISHPQKDIQYQSLHYFSIINLFSRGMLLSKRATASATEILCSAITLPYWVMN